MESVEARIVGVWETGTDNDDPIFAARMAKPREKAFLAIQPLPHGIEDANNWRQFYLNGVGTVRFCVPANSVLIETGFAHGFSPLPFQCLLEVQNPIDE